MFRAPDSSSPPSTPNARQPRSGFGRYDASEPSTTPAGPPPTGNSTTPIGPPPSSIFYESFNDGSSTYPARNKLFDTLGKKSSPSIRQPLALNDSEDDYDAMEEDTQDLSEFTSYPESQGPAAQRPENTQLTAIAKALTSDSAPLTEPDDLILETEHILGDLRDATIDRQDDRVEVDLAISSAIHQLSNTWGEGRLKKHTGHDISAGIGAPQWSSACFLTDLLLPLHHPPEKGTLQYSARSSRPGLSTKAIPQVLLDWLRSHYNPFAGDYEDVINHDINPACHDRFWDLIFNSVLRGNLSIALQLLKRADFRVAGPGYEGKQLSNIQKVTNHAVETLQACPAVENGDWNVTNSDWVIFRKKVAQANANLEAFAEASEEDERESSATVDDFEHSSIGSNGLASIRGSLSKIPWTIQQNLRYLYTQLQGDYSEILAASANWLEASIGLTVWWDGEDSGLGKDDLRMSRRADRRPQKLRLVDVNPTKAYQQRLSMSLALLFDDPDNANESDLQINPASALEVGIACIFENHIEDLIGILKSLSWPIAAATAEIAYLGGWSGASPEPSQQLLSGFDQSDLMVLSYGPKSKALIQKDEVLESYARQLETHRTVLKDQKGIDVEVRQITIKLLARMQDQRKASGQIDSMLQGLKLEDSVRVDQAVSLCQRLGLHDQARKLSLRYADHLLDKSHQYGEAILQYAKAYESRKMKEVLDSLTILSVTQSTAYPPASELDRTLDELISTPKRAISKFGALDQEAAKNLLAHASGYATLRRFYNLRDQGLIKSVDRKPLLKPTARKKEAAKALLAVISSAADSIHGSLHDESIDSAIPIDSLLVLLGEALVFLKRKWPIEVIDIS